MLPVTLKFLNCFFRDLTNWCSTVLPVALKSGFGTGSLLDLLLITAHFRNQTTASALLGKFSRIMFAAQSNILLKRMCTVTLEEGGAAARMKHEMKRASARVICIKFFHSRAEHIIISSELSEPLTEQHVQKQSWWIWICLDQTTMTGKEKVTFRYILPCMSYQPASLLLSYFLSN